MLVNIAAYGLMGNLQYNDFFKVTANHESLLVQAAGVDTLEDKLRTVKLGLNEVSASQEKYVIQTLYRVPTNYSVLSFQLRNAP